MVRPYFNRTYFGEDVYQINDLGNKICLRINAIPKSFISHLLLNREDKLVLWNVPLLHFTETKIYFSIIDFDIPHLSMENNSTKLDSNNDSRFYIMFVQF